jgi:hypothetical protein
LHYPILRLGDVGLELLRSLAFYKAMQPTYFPAVAKALRVCATSSEELLQFKVLQVCAAASESEKLITDIGPALSIIESIFLVLGGSKSGASMAAEATLHQAVKASLLHVEACHYRYERMLRDVADPDNVEQAHARMENAADVSAQVLQEVMVLCSKKNSDRLKYSKPERGTVVAMEVIQDAVRSRAAVFTMSGPLTSLIVNSMCPILLQQLHRIGGGTLRMLPSEDQKAYNRRVAMAVAYLNTVSVLLSHLPRVNDDRKPCDQALLVNMANLLAMLVDMAQGAKPSWVRLVALEVLQDFCQAPGLAYRVRHIFSLCRNFDEMEMDELVGDEDASSENILVSLISTLEALSVKLLDAPDADAGPAGARVIVSDKLQTAIQTANKKEKSKCQAPLVTLTRSLIVAPTMDAGGRWIPALDALRDGDLSAVGRLGAGVGAGAGAGAVAGVGGGHDGVLLDKEMAKNKTARSELIERVRAEMALMCCTCLMESMAGMCGVVYWRYHSPDALSVAHAPTRDEALMVVNAEECWKLMKTCAPSLMKVSRVAFTVVESKPLVRAMAQAASSMTQAATVLSLVKVRDMSFRSLCALSEDQIPSPDFSRAPSRAPSAEVAKSKGTAKDVPRASKELLRNAAADVPATSRWDWRRSLLTQELLGLVLETAAEMYEAWTVVLPVLQRLHFELRLRVQNGCAVMSLPVSAPASASASVADSVASTAHATGDGGETDGITALSLLANLEALFSTAWVLPDEALVELLRGLARLAPDNEDTGAVPAPAHTENGDAGAAPSMGDGRWGINQTLIVARQNFWRLHVMYDAISKQLAVLASNPSASMREYASQNMTQLANDALTFLSNPLALSAEVAARHGAAYKQDVKAAERSILASYQAMYASPFSDVKHSVLAGLLQLLQSFASKRVSLTSGWQPLLHFLASVSQEKKEASIIRAAAANLQTICQSLLSHLAPLDLEVLAMSLRAMGAQDTDRQSALGAIGLLRELASFLTSNRAPLIQRLISPSDELMARGTVPAAAPAPAAIWQQMTDEASGNPYWSLTRCVLDDRARLPLPSTAASPRPCPARRVHGRVLLAVSM